MPKIKEWDSKAEVKKGDRVEKLQILFKTKSSLGRQRVWQSVLEGKVDSVDLKNRKLFFLINLEEEKLKAPVSGKIFKISKKEIKISFSALRVRGKSVGSFSGWGLLGFLLKPIKQYN